MNKHSPYILSGVKTEILTAILAPGYMSDYLFWNIFRSLQPLLYWTKNNLIFFTFVKECANIKVEKECTLQLTGEGVPIFRSLMQINLWPEFFAWQTLFDLWQEKCQDKEKYQVITITQRFIKIFLFFIVKNEIFSVKSDWIVRVFILIKNNHSISSIL